jgi:hypothetical protein
MTITHSELSLHVSTSVRSENIKFFLDEVKSVLLFSYIQSLNIVTVTVSVQYMQQETQPVFSGRYMQTRLSYLNLPRGRDKKRTLIEKIRLTGASVAQPSEQSLFTSEGHFRSRKYSTDRKFSEIIICYKLKIFNFFRRKICVDQMGQSHFTTFSFCGKFSKVAMGLELSCGPMTLVWN